MKFALISPLQFLSDTWKTNYQLMLPHMLVNYQYADMYKALCNSPTQFVILDNGAAESVDAYNAKALLLIAEHFGVDEVVATDVLGNAAVTRETTTRFVRQAREMDWQGRIGMVAQGETIYQAFDLVMEVAEDYPEIVTIYLPRLLVTKTAPHARITLAKKIHKWAPGLDIHFLGASRLWSAELHSAASDIPWVRGMDTSMPYVYARHGARVDQDLDRVAPPHRESDGSYFSGTWDPKQRGLATDNVERMLKWSVGAG